MSTPFRVVFVDPSLKADLEKLEKGTFEEQRLAGWIRKAIDRLVIDSKYGVKVPSSLWPKVYIQEYKITNLWKIDLPHGWHMMYTIRKHELDLLGVILEWLDHARYERRHHY
ncbi:MAG: hypothetical protein V1776_00790 [Candidatus Diapherotrites archaeon]